MPESVVTKQAIDDVFKERLDTKSFEKINLTESTGT